MSQALAEKRIVIIGGTTGLGLLAATAFVRKGAQVIVVGRNADSCAFALNLTSLMLSNLAAVQAFLAQGTGGTILNMGSVLGYSPSPTYFATHAYAATKSAVIGFTKSIAAYNAKNNIRVNVLAPALVETPMAQRAATDDTIQTFIHTKQPLTGGRIGQPSDLDGAAVYFLSDTSLFTTGQILSVDGGWSISGGQYTVISDGR